MSGLAFGTALDLGAGSFTAVAPIDSSHALAVWDAGASGAVLTVTPSAVSAGPTQTVAADAQFSTDNEVLAALGGNNFLLLYQDIDTNLRAMAVHVSGTTISVGAGVTVDPGDGSVPARLAVLSPASVLAAWEDNDSNGYTAILSVSGLAVSISPVVQFTTSSSIIGVAEDGLDASHAIVAWTDLATTPQSVQIAVATETGGTVSLGTAATIATTNTLGIIDIIALSATRGVALLNSFAPASDTDHSLPVLCPFTVSGGAVSVGTPTVVESAWFLVRYTGGDPQKVGAKLSHDGHVLAYAGMNPGLTGPLHPPFGASLGVSPQTNVTSAGLGAFQVDNCALAPTLGVTTYSALGGHAWAVPWSFPLVVKPRNTRLWRDIG